MATLAEIRSSVRTNIGEPTAGYWTDDMLNGYINDAARTFSIDTGILVAEPRKADVTSGTAIYNLPDECPGPHAVIALLYDDDELTKSTPQAILRHGDLPASDTGTPERWYPVTRSGAASIALHPIPDSNLTDGLRIWYWKQAAEMSADTDTCDIPDDYIVAVEAKATELAFLAKHMFDDAAVWRSTYQAEVKRARAYVNAMVYNDAADRSTEDENVRTVF